MPDTILKRGDHGPAVTRLQKLLTKNDAPWRFYWGAIDGVFGKKTEAAVKRSKFLGGYEKADINGQAGDTLRGYLRDWSSRPAKFKTRTKARYAALQRDVDTTDMAGKAWDAIKRRLGDHETPAGSNHSPETVEWGHGNMAWCGVTVSLCYLAAGSKAFDKSEGKYQYVPAIISAAQAGGHGLKIVTTPKHGDLIIWDYPGGGSFDHVSMFGGWTDSDRDWMVEIGGNEGPNGVVKRDVSSRDYVAHYVRVTD